VKTANVQYGNFKPISSDGLILLVAHFASVNHITALRILNLYPEQKTFTNYYTLLPACK